MRAVAYCALRILLVVILMVDRRPAEAACNLIPQVVKTFDSVRGSTNRPYAAPGEPLELRVRPCDPGGPGFTAPAANYVVTVVFTPAGGSKNVVVLAANCAGIGSCAGAASTTCVPVTVGNELALVPHDSELSLRLTFPDTDTLLAPSGDALGFSGPATIAVKDSTVAPMGQAAACELVTQTCGASTGTTGLVACVDEFFTNDGACGRTLSQGTFNHFTALPPPNDYQTACFDTVGPCNPGTNPLRLTTDRDGNALIPMDWRGILVQQNQVPVPRLLSATIDAPALPLKIPGKSFVASYTPEGALLPPIFEPQFVAQALPGALNLFGSADAPYTVLRLARRSETFQHCTGGFNDAGPCNGSDDCPGACVGGSNAGARCSSNADCTSTVCGATGTCGPTLCSATSSNPGTPCNSDALCPGGECGPALFNVSPLATSGVGPVTIGRLASAGICQQSVLPPNTETMCTPMLACSGDGPCVHYALTAESPVPLDGLMQTNDVFTFAVNEAVPVQDLNGDGDGSSDTSDTVVTLRDRATGQVQPLGASPGCGIVGTPVGRAVVRSQQIPFSFPAVATEGDLLAFLESEATTNKTTPPHLPCDENNDGDAIDTIVRAFRLGVGEITPTEPNPTADAAQLINGRALAVSNGQVFFRTAEAQSISRQTTRVSVGPGATQLTLGSSMGAGIRPCLSYDGRYAVLTTTDPSVVTTPMLDGSRHIIVRDLKTGTNEVIDVDNSNVPGIGDEPSISADGRWVVFYTFVSNVLGSTVPTCTSFGGPHACGEIALRDRCVSNGSAVPGCTPHTEAVSVDGMGSLANGDAEDPTVSADGRFVAFKSWATNLIANDTNVCNSAYFTSGPCPDIFVHDRCLSNGIAVPNCSPGNLRVSEGPGHTQALYASDNPVLSAHGNYVAFENPQLLPIDGNLIGDIYGVDLLTGAIELRSRDANTGLQVGGILPAVSADGRVVAFESASDVAYVHDRVAGALQQISVDSNGRPAMTGTSGGGGVSADGRFVAFISSAFDLVPGITNTTARGDIFVFDRATGGIERVTLSSTGSDPDGSTNNVSISGDGRSVLFSSGASNLIAGDTNGAGDVFRFGPDLNSVAGDLTGDGDVDDTVLRTLSGTTGTIATLCPATQVSVAAGAAAFLRPERAGSTPSLSTCPAGVAVTDGISLNGDSDADDDVVHFADRSGTVQNLSRAATAVSLSSQCTSGTNAAHACTADTDCPSGSCAATWLAALVAEADQGNADLNNDSDTTDTVVQVHRVSDAATSWTNVGQAADTLQMAGSLAVFITPEAEQNARLDADTDKTDRVLQVYDAVAHKLTNTAQPAQEFVVGNETIGCGTSPLIAFRTHEADLCGVAINTAKDSNCPSNPLPAGCALAMCDLDNDGDCCDDVLQVYANGLGVINTHQQLTPCLLEACDPRLPYRVLGSKVKFLTTEKYANRDLDGDGSQSSLILQQFEACTKTVTVIGPVEPNPPPGTAIDPLDPPTGAGGVVHTPSGRCVLGLQTLLVPASCVGNSDCPAGATCQATVIAAAPDSAPHHDSAVITRGALYVKIPLGRPSVLTFLKVALRNADLGEKPGHTLRLVATDGTCPAGTVSGLPILSATKTAKFDTALVAGGKARIAAVPLTINASAFTSANVRAAHRCTLQLVASTVAAGNVDPTPLNNVLPVELNVFDLNDPDPAMAHQSVLYSTGPAVGVLKKGRSMVAVNVKLLVGNADLLPAPDIGDIITVTVSDGTCPTGTVGSARMNGTLLNSVAVDGGQLRKGYLPLAIDGSKFKTANVYSPRRCIAQVTATGPGGDTDATNNSSNLVIDVIDVNDF